MSEEQKVEWYRSEQTSSISEQLRLLAESIEQSTAAIKMLAVAMDAKKSNDQFFLRLGEEQQEKNPEQQS